MQHRDRWRDLALDRAKEEAVRAGGEKKKYKKPWAKKPLAKKPLAKKPLAKKPLAKKPLAKSRWL